MRRRRASPAVRLQAAAARPASGTCRGPGRGEAGRAGGARPGAGRGRGLEARREGGGRASHRPLSTPPRPLPSGLPPRPLFHRSPRVRPLPWGRSSGGDTSLLAPPRPQRPRRGDHPAGAPPSWLCCWQRCGVGDWGAAPRGGPPRGRFCSGGQRSSWGPAPPLGR